MKPVNIFGAGTFSRSKNATAQERVNLYLEQNDDKGITAYGRPGLSLFCTADAVNPIRGIIIRQANERVFIVVLNKFYRVDTLGNLEERGTLLTTTGFVDMAENGVEIFITDGTYGYIYNINAVTFTQITSTDYPGASSVTFNDGYFIVSKPSSGQFYISKSYAGLTWDATMFATAESNPDNLVRVFSDHGQVILFGTYNTEFWGDSGAEDFPYTRISGVTAEWGLSAKYSVAKFSSSLIMLGKNHLGDSQVVLLSGYNFTVISTPDIDSRIKDYVNVADATAFSYVSNGHNFYQLAFTEANESWLYDGTSNIWSQLKYGPGTIADPDGGYGTEENRHRAEFSVISGRNIYVTDYEHGIIYTLDSNVYTDNGEPIIFEFVTKHLMTDLERQTINELQLDMETGVGLDTGQGNNPQVMLQVSRDNGHTYGPERWSSFGAIGNYTARAIWRRLGIGRDWVFKIRISDPVKRAINGIWIR